MQKYTNSQIVEVSEDDSEYVSVPTVKQTAIKLAKEGRGRGTKIRHLLVEKFGEGNVPSLGTLNGWIKPIPNTNLKKGDKRTKETVGYLDLAYDPKNPLPELQITDEHKSYINRIGLVKKFIFRSDKAVNQLSNREAKHAKRTFLEFQDPYGERVDLIAQWAVVHELSERETYDDFTHDIEEFFTYAPWKKRINQDLYRVAKKNKEIERYVQFRFISPRIEAPTVERITNEYKLFVGMHSHLGLPYFISFISGDRIFHLDRNHPQLMELVESHKEEWKLDCDWRKYVGDRLEGAPVKPIHVGQAKEQSND